MVTHSHRSKNIVSQILLKPLRNLYGTFGEPYLNCWRSLLQPLRHFCRTWLKPSLDPFWNLKPSKTYREPCWNLLKPFWNLSEIFPKPFQNLSKTFLKPSGILLEPYLKLWNLKPKIEWVGTLWNNLNCTWTIFHREQGRAEVMYIDRGKKLWHE